MKEHSGGCWDAMSSRGQDGEGRTGEELGRRLKGGVGAMRDQRIRTMTKAYLQPSAGSNHQRQTPSRQSN